MSAAPGPPAPDPRQDALTWGEYDSLALEFRILAAAAHDGIRAEPTLGIDNMRRQLVAIEAEANAQSAKYAELSYYAGAAVPAPPAGPEEIIHIDNDGRVVKSTVLAEPEREGPCDGRGERDTQEERPQQRTRPATIGDAVANPPVTSAPPAGLTVDIARQLANEYLDQHVPKSAIPTTRAALVQDFAIWLAARLAARRAPTEAMIDAALVAFTRRVYPPVWDATVALKPDEAHDAALRAGIECALRAALAAVDDG